SDFKLEGTESFRILVRIPHDEMTLSWDETHYEPELHWIEDQYGDPPLLEGYWEYPVLIEEQTIPGEWIEDQYEDHVWIDDQYDENDELVVPGHFEDHVLTVPAHQEPDTIIPAHYEPPEPICHDCVFGDPELLVPAHWEGGD